MTGSLHFVPMRPTSWYVPGVAVAGLPQTSVVVTLGQVIQYVRFSFGWSVRLSTP